MRSACLLVLALAGVALPAPTLDELSQDPPKKKEIEKGRKILDKYFKAEAEQLKGGRNQAAQAGAQRAAQAEFLAWLAATPATLGTDLGAQPDSVIQMLDEQRIPYLEGGFKKGSLEYVKVEGAKGMERHEYAILVPKAYDPKKKIPVVLSLHGRTINPRHPAFRSAPFNERSRETIWNNWLKTQAAEEAIVLAPTTNPDGFLFAENHGADLQALYRTLGEALTLYRGDWDRVFLEVHGRALRVACEQSLMFAGFIVRDRVDDRRAPFIPPEEFFLLENLNGVPLLYVADAANWNDVGQPMANALTAAYAKAGKPDNLVVVQAQRDVDGALRGGEDKILDFVRKHQRPRARETFAWRFFQQTQGAPFPLVLTLMNFNYDANEEARKAPLAAKAGRVVFEVRRETVKDAEGKELTVNRIDLKVTEAEEMNILLYEPLVSFDLPITVTVNGKPTAVTAKKLERDWEMFFSEILPRRFLMMPVLGMVRVPFEHQPEFVPATPPGKPAEEGAAKPDEGSPAGGDAPKGAADSPK
jgi:hypothetical protein